MCVGVYRWSSGWRGMVPALRAVDGGGVPAYNVLRQAACIRDEVGEGRRRRGLRAIGRGRVDAMFAGRGVAGAARRRRALRHGARRDEVRSRIDRVWVVGDVVETWPASDQARAAASGGGAGGSGA